MTVTLGSQPNQLIQWRRQRTAREVFGQENACLRNEAVELDELRKTHEVPVASLSDLTNPGVMRYFRVVTSLAIRNP